MTLWEALQAAGMTPPRSIIAERWMRFPGIGKGLSNRAGWCRLIAPTLAIYGDWSSNFSAIWRDETHRDNAETARLLADARARERSFAAAQHERQARVALECEQIIGRAIESHHPYLSRKGFPEAVGLVASEKLLIPIRDVCSYRRIISIQEISAEGDKRFVAGGRTRGGIYRIGHPGARRIALCEGYATGLSISEALARLSGSHCIIVCFSAMNMVAVAERFAGAVICADNDLSATGEEAAKRTGLKWTMPLQVGNDFNDVMLHEGIHVVVRALSEVFSG